MWDWPPSLPSWGSQSEAAKEQVGRKNNTEEGEGAGDFGLDPSRRLLLQRGHFQNCLKGEREREWQCTGGAGDKAEGSVDEVKRQHTDLAEGRVFQRLLQRLFQRLLCGEKSA